MEKEDKILFTKKEKEEKKGKEEREGREKEGKEEKKRRAVFYQLFPTLPHHGLSPSLLCLPDLQMISFLTHRLQLPLSIEQKFVKGVQDIHVHAHCAKHG